MKKLLLVSSILCLSITKIFAQDIAENKLILEDRGLNNVYINLLGDMSHISINYERLFPLNEQQMFSAKIGLGYNEEFTLCFMGSCGNDLKFITIPHHFTFNYGNGRHYGEFGLGGTLVLGETINPYAVYPIIGYRIWPFNKLKMNFRVYAQYPLNGIENLEPILFIPIGFSMGITF